VADGDACGVGQGRSWAIRFRAYGKRRYVSLGTAEEGWNRKRAEAELRHVLADVERGIWRPYEPAQAPQVAEAPTFHEFASEWLENREPELRPKTVESYRWQLSGHLLPHFARMHLDQIGPEDVDRYKAAKLREGALGPNQINKSLGLLAMILDAAGDYGHVDPARNPARGRRRRVKRSTPSRPTVEPEQLPSLLETAGKLRPILATMAGAGLRNGEACALDWPDFDSGSGTLTVAASKTDAGLRRVDLPSALRREQAAQPPQQQRGADVPQPQRAAAERRQRRAALEDRDPSRQRAARRARHPADRRSGHAALAASPLRQPALRPGRRSRVRGGPAGPYGAGLLDEGLR
jgi:integrase